MNLEEFKSEYFEQDKKFQSQIDSGGFYTEFASQQSLIVSNLIHKALTSEDKDLIIDFIAFLIYAGSTQEVIAIKLHGYLNEKAIPIINDQENFNASLKSANSLLNMIVEKNTIARRKGAETKLAKDLKQKEKMIVKECWDNWQIKPHQYRNNTNFATAMIEKFRPDNPDDESKHLSSVKVISDWCSKWKKSAC